MTASSFSATDMIDAPPELVYGIIADYQNLHPRILPRPPFVSLSVESGGIGAGTVMRVEMRMLGRLQTFRAVVAEPDPGHMLVETIIDSGYVTTFTVESVAQGQRARVTIATEIPPRAGIAGMMERWLVARLLRPAYVRELRILESVAQELASAPRTAMLTDARTTGRIHSVQGVGQGGA